jgi:hypothetical protein
MPGIDVKPGFWGKFRQAMPGALNAVAQQVGPDYLRPMARATGGMLPNPQMKGGTSPGQPVGDRTGPGVVRPPSGFDFGGINPALMNPTASMGNAGNMGMMGMGGAGGANSMMMPNMGNISGLWNAYNRLSGLGSQNPSVPSRGLFF